MTSAVEPAEAFLVALLGTFLVLWVFSGVVAVWQFIARHVTTREPSRPRTVEELHRVSTNANARPKQGAGRAARQSVAVAERQIEADYVATERQFAAMHRQARISMHEAAGNGWRNIAE